MSTRSQFSDFRQRRIAVGRNGMAATSHPQSTLAAINVLQAGGNAVDAAIAAVAVQCVVEPLSTGLGGDCFAIYCPKGRAPIGLNGSGRAPSDVRLPDVVAQSDGKRIPAFSAHAVTVPGAADAWCRLLADYGTVPLKELLRPAIQCAEQGFCVTPRVSIAWGIFSDVLRKHAPAQRHFLPGDKAPSPGSVFRQPSLGATLRRIADHGRDGFYTGPIAKELVDILAGFGGRHSLDDFASYRANYEQPISAKYRGHDVVECAPNAQGITALMILRILDGFDLKSQRFSNADRIHLLAEATKAAYRARDAYLSDPQTRSPGEPLFLTSSVIDRLHSKIDLSRASADEEWDLPEHSDTVCLSVVDRDRNAISFINSLFGPFGSGDLRAGKRHLAAQPWIWLQHHRRTSKRHRARQAPVAHFDPWDAHEGRPRGHVVRRDGWALSGRRPCPDTFVHARPWHGCAGRRRCTTKLRIRRRALS